MRKQAGSVRSGLPRALSVSVSMGSLKSRWCLAGERRGMGEAGMDKQLGIVSETEHGFCVATGKQKSLNSSEADSLLHILNSHM